MSNSSDTQPHPHVTQDDNDTVAAALGESLRTAYVDTRFATEAFAARLSDEDQLLQAMPEASPIKWHRAHTTWFFETFILRPRGIAAFDQRYSALFNSYYEALGPRHARPKRGLISRPTVAEIGLWRRHVDGLMLELLDSPRANDAEFVHLVRLGLAHEEQHFELMQTDLLAAFACNPLMPTYVESPPRLNAEPFDTQVVWKVHEGGRVDIGADAEVPFAFDNEGPRHPVWLAPYAIANRLVTIGEWYAFARDGGYTTPALWLAEGIDWVRANKIEGPAYTKVQDDVVVVYGLHGARVADPCEPILHLSFYEADALATWLHARLPTEHEWEAAAKLHGETDGEPFGSGYVPRLPALQRGPRLQGLFNQAWQWTRSSYAPYPGFRPSGGAVGEYNGKFMVNQQILRGSSIFTPRGHSRVTYRNFWHPQTQFQAAGLRLARNV